MCTECWTRHYHVRHPHKCPWASQAACAYACIFTFTHGNYSIQHFPAFPMSLSNVQIIILRSSSLSSIWDFWRMFWSPRIPFIWHWSCLLSHGQLSEPWQSFHSQLTQFAFFFKWLLQAVAIFQGSCGLRHVPRLHIPPHTAQLNTGSDSSKTSTHTLG